MRAATKILLDVLAYRLRHLEMANMAAAISVMVALRLPFADVAVRSVFALVLNVLAYLINDVVDVERDLASGRAPDKTRFLAEHVPAAHGAGALCAAVLAAIALSWSPWLLLPAVLGSGICWAYSAYFKRMPYADVLSMVAWGAAMPLVAVPPDRALGWLLLGQLALFSATFELIQVLRDRDSDAALGIETTAVRLGPERTLLATRITVLVASAYAVLALHRWIGAALAVAVLLSGRPAPERYWNRVRLVYGVTWLALIAWITWRGAADGVLTD